MATHWGSVTSNTSKFGAYIVITEVANSMNIEKNTTQVKVDFHITRSNWGWISSRAFSGNVVINGETHSFTYSPNWSAGSSGDVIIASFTTTVEHNTDGSKWCEASATWWTDGSYSCGTASASGGLTLTTIPRASTPYCPDFNIGASTIINISRASSNFKHTLKYTFGNLSETIVEKTSEANVGWQAPTDFFAEIPNAQKGTGTITCQTYNGDTLIGTKTTSFTAFVVDSEPEVDVEILDILEKTLNITGNNKKFVRNVSTAQVKVTAEAKNSSTIASYKIKNGSKTLVEAISTFEEVETNTFEITVTDSRGFFTTITKEIEIYEYINPVYVNVLLDRPSTDSAEITAEIVGQWFNGIIGNTPNTLVAKYQYSEDDGDTWSAWKTLTLTTDGNTFSFNGSLGSEFNSEANILFNFTIQDIFKSGVGAGELGKGIPLLDIGDDDIKINGINYIDLIYPIGRGFIDFTDTDYSNYLGLTWERELIGMTPVGLNADDEDFNEIGKTGGEKTHTLTVDEMPSHTHDLGYDKNDLMAGGSAKGDAGRGATGYGWNTFATGGSQPHNNMQPYQVVAYWKRVA